MRLTWLVFGVLALLCSRPAAAATAAADAVGATRAAQPPALDPALEDPAWQAGAIALKPQFVDLTTRRGAPVETAAYLLYDDRTLYVAFRCAQPAIPIVATQTTNNVGFGIDDFVGIGIDPGGGGSQVYYFEATPRGVRYQQASENARYAPAWTAAAKVEGTGWSAVFAIPLAAMRLHGGPQRWRINLIRQLAATGEHLTWSFDGLMNDGPVGTAWPNFTDVRFWPALAGMQLARAGATRHEPRADVFGLAAAGSDRDRFAQANQSFAVEHPRNAGIDLAVPVTDTITFVGTLAPDFSNVEVDQQTIAPQEFARQFIEYRPFFAQGAAFLNPNPIPVGGAVSPQNSIFYSPSIGPFDRGAKIEGTHGNDSFGVLSARGYDVTGGSAFDDVAYGFKHALPDRTFLYWADGVLAHHSVAGSDETTEAGVEGRSLRSGFIWFANEAIEHGSALGGSSHSSDVFLDVHKPNYELYTRYQDLGAHYGPLDGFTSIADVRGPSVSLTLLGNGTRVKNWTLSLFGDRFLDGSGAVHEADTYAFLTAVFKNQLSINNLGLQTGVLRSYALPADADCSGPSVGRSTYSGAPCYRDGRSDRFNLVVASFGYRDGTPTPTDWSYSAGPFGGNALHQFTLVTSRPLAGRFSLSVEYDGSWERADAGGALDSQFLRRVGIGASLGADTTLAFSLRSITGTGGFALPGTNLAASFHRHYRNGNELYVDFGTPASTATLDRLIAKYAVHVGPLPGT